VILYLAHSENNTIRQEKGGCDMVLFTLPCFGAGAERI
jgi:hypothetical protein